MSEYPKDPPRISSDPWTQAPPRVENSEREHWESKLIRDLASASLKEQRRSRRWGIFFKLMTFAYITFVIVAAMKPQFSLNQAAQPLHTATIDISGMIVAGGEVSAKRLIHSLQTAFENPSTAGVILNINSPGGSPVQSGIIYDEIIRLRQQYPSIPLYAVVGDICASGAYYIAAAADRIYADKASIVGSIGVRMDSFGLTGLMEKIGVERRILTSGENKALLDPFSPLDQYEKSYLQRLLDEIHQQFITAVKEGRGDRLIDNPELFSGLIWSGEQSIENGLVDALGNDLFVAREVIGVKKMVSFDPKKPLLDQLSQQLGVSFANAIEALIPRNTFRIVYEPE